MDGDWHPADLAAAIKNEVKVAKRLTATHREISFRVGRHHGLDLTLADYVRALCPRYAPELVTRWIADGRLTVDGKPTAPGLKLAPEMLVELRVPLPPPDPTYVPPPLNLLHADEDLLVANKEVGHLAHQAGRIMTDTLLNQLQDWVLAHGGDPNQVRLVNRIDRHTSGIVLASRHLDAHIDLSRAIERRQVLKEYRAICHRVPAPRQGHWLDPIGDGDGTSVARVVRADGQACDTEYEVLETAKNQGFALLRLILHTGRQHQIRVHAAHHGCPLVGDWVYGTPCREFDGQALHAAVLEFAHPRDQRRLRIEAPFPPTLARLWESLKAGGQVTPATLNDEQKSKLGLVPRRVWRAD
jgi:23S rRNA pseudouridine1911/1915/1917 synthase